MLERAINDGSINAYYLHDHSSCRTEGCDASQYLIKSNGYCAPCSRRRCVSIKQHNHQHGHPDSSCAIYVGPCRRLENGEDVDVPIDADEVDEQHRTTTAVGEKVLLTSSFRKEGRDHVAGVVAAAVATVVVRAQVWGGVGGRGSRGVKAERRMSEQQVRVAERRRRSQNQLNRKSFTGVKRMPGEENDRTFVPAKE